MRPGPTRSAGSQGNGSTDGRCLPASSAASRVGAGRRSRHAGRRDRGSLVPLGTRHRAVARPPRGPPRILDPRIDELLRYITPLPQIGRRVTRDTTVGGMPVTEGSWVSIAYRFANHDPEAFPDPSTCSLDRSPDRHVSFGCGPHTCVGMHVAHVVIRSILEALRARAPQMRLIEPFVFESWIDLTASPTASSGSSWNSDDRGG